MQILLRSIFVFLCFVSVTEASDCNDNFDNPEAISLPSDLGEFMALLNTANFKKMDPMLSRRVLGLVWVQSKSYSVQLDVKAKNIQKIATKLEKGGFAYLLEGDVFIVQANLIQLSKIAGFKKVSKISVSEQKIDVDQSAAQSISIKDIESLKFKKFSEGLQNLIWKDIENSGTKKLFTGLARVSDSSSQEISSLFDSASKMSATVIVFRKESLFRLLHATASKVIVSISIGQKM